MSKIAPRAKGEVRSTPLFEKCHRYEVAERVRQAGVYSFFRVIESAQDPEVVSNGRRMIMLGSNNYLGLTNDPRVKEAAVDAIRKYGSGCAGSRFLNGTLDLHVRLEERLAEFMRQDAAVTFATGYQVNLGTISCLVGKGDVVYLDKQDHACIIDGARLSFGDVRKFKHNDPADLARQMRNDSTARGRFIVVDGVFSMEGDIAPLPQIVAAALATIEIMEREPERRTKLWENARFFSDGLKSLGLDTAGSETPVVPVVVGSDDAALAMVQRLDEEGVFVNCVLSPATRPGRALIRTSLMATHTREHLTRALEAIEKVARELRLPRPDAS